MIRFRITVPMLAAGLLALGATSALAQTSPVPAGPSGQTPSVAEPRKVEGERPSSKPSITIPERDAADALPKVTPLESIPPVIETIDPTVFAVRVIGPWTQGETQGFSRVILLAEGDTPHLYVQWIEQPAESEPNVQTTVEIDQVADDKLVFGDIRVEASENDASVFLDTRVDVQGFRETFVLNVGGPGHARFGPATN